ncbi:hypothetical protein [Clostridium grantii]|uniref:Uncharacterized protein n=1 Tax=Clostridium grantii DSM 8605 TaxID=1121316 RepID=A0A1M5QZ13_9CLOT|nr:hypothetical protein [Clostridium grantii]SHH19375.1 hypothetical protein SAMN02745207_00387 [Clostridium grantii DSM 8605]
MKFTILIMYICIIFFLENKYEIVNRFENKENTRFKKIINYMCLIAIILFLLVHLLLPKLNVHGIKNTYIESILSFPIFLRYYIHIRVREINRNKQQQIKKEPIQLNFCYFCGSELNGSNICPSCGKVLE